MPIPEKHKSLLNTKSIVHQELNVLNLVRKGHEEHMHLPGVCGFKERKKENAFQASSHLHGKRTNQGPLVCGIPRPPQNRSMDRAIKIWTRFMNPIHGHHSWTWYLEPLLLLPMYKQRLKACFIAGSSFHASLPMLYRALICVKHG